MEAMATYSTDDLILELLGEHTIRRSIVRISTEQKKLLDGDVAWSHDHCRRQQIFNVPAQVLQDLKTSYSRRIETKRSRKDSISSNKKQHNVASQGSIEKERDDSESVATPEHYDEREPEPNTQTNPGNEDKGGDEGEGGDEDETKTQVSWYTSDDEHMHPPQAQVQDGQEDFQTQVPLRSTPSDPSQAPPTLPPMPPPPAIPDRSASNDNPSSSPNPSPEDELELEVPAALEVDVAPVNKVAQPVISPMLATPPSAQVVPCTYEPQELLASPEREEKTKQKRKQPVYKEIPELYHPPKSAAVTSLRTGKAGMSPSKPALIDIQSSSSTDTSSIIPATSIPIPSHDLPRDVVNPLPESSQHRPASSLESLAPRERLGPQYNTSSLEGPAFSKPRQESPVYVPPPSPKVPSSPPPSTSAPGPEPVTQPAKQPEAPFIEFTIAYPQYTGSLNDFVTACIYLKTLVAKRRLRPFLFDDFVRAWTEGYLPYIRECDESDPPTKALRAIEWFNQLDGAPVFTKHILTVPELDRVLEFYPDEAPPSSRETHKIPGYARAAEAADKGKEVAKSSLATTTSSQSSLKSSAPSIDRGYRGSQGAASTVAEVLDEEPPQAGKLAAPPPPPPPPPPPAPDRAQPTPGRASSKPISEPPKRPNSTGFTRSLSEAASASHKRKAPSAEFLIPPPKKTSTGGGSRAVPRSPSGSSARSDESRATTATTTGGGGNTRRRYADDPEKRRQMFGMYLKKKRQKEGIASSAPVHSNSTPTSGQKGQ